MRYLFWVALLSLLLFGASNPDVVINGQYRVNAYSVSTGHEAYRARIRQGVVVKFDEQLKTDARFQLSHTTANITDAYDVNSHGVTVRHAFVAYTPDANLEFRWGFVPVMEYAEDILYSKGWGYNPLAAELSWDDGHWLVHGFVAQLVEGSETQRGDDTQHGEFDLFYIVNDTITTGVINSVMQINSATYLNSLLKIEYRVGERATIDIIGGGSYTSKEIINTSSDAIGWMGLVKYETKIENQTYGLMLTHASGDQNRNGYYVPMSFAKTDSYWGYTGILTVQYPTDTGIDQDSIHISNNGYGLTTLQLKIQQQINSKFKLYGGLGWFGNTQTSRDTNVGVDGLVMGSMTLHKNLGFDFGYSGAYLSDSVSGYKQTNGAFNNTLGEYEYKSMVFARIQVEY